MMKYKEALYAGLVMGLFSLFVNFMGFAGGISRIPVDTLQVGNPSAPETKKIEFRINNASLPYIGVPVSNPDTLQATTNKLKLGNGSSGEKQIELHMGLASNPIIGASSSGDEFTLNKKKLKIGNGVATDASIELSVGLASNPKLSYDNTNSALKSDRNNLTVGNGIAGDKKIVLDVGSVNYESNPMIKWDNSNSKVKINKSKIEVGDNSNDTFYLKVEMPTSVSFPDQVSLPAIRYVKSTNLWEFSNNGVSYASFGSSSGGGGGGGGGGGTDWFASAYIEAGSGQAELSAGAVTTYDEITKSDLTLYNVSGAITSQIACASGTASTGTTCSVDESLGISFTQTSTCAPRVCAQFGKYLRCNGACYGEATFQIIETPNASDSITLLGGGAVPHFIDERYTGGLDDVYSITVCGTFNTVNSGTQKTYRLMYERPASSGSIQNDAIITNLGASRGNANVHFYASCM